MTEHIPLGQPILIGHHSEKRDRTYRQKIKNTYSKAIEASDKAAYYADKASTIENNKAIFSDDPNAIEKLDEKIDELVKLQEFMKVANKLIRKQDKEGFLKLEGTTEQQWQILNQKDCFENLGYAPFELTNNNANIRRLKLRREELKSKESLVTVSETIKGVRLVQNAEANRVQLIFPEQPSKETCLILSKKYNFHYCKLENAWRRHLNNAGFYAAKQFLEHYQEDQNEA